MSQFPEGDRSITLEPTMYELLSAFSEHTGVPIQHALELAVALFITDPDLKDSPVQLAHQQESAKSVIYEHLQALAAGFNLPPQPDDNLHEALVEYVAKLIRK